MILTLFNQPKSSADASSLSSFAKFVPGTHTIPTELHNVPVSHFSQSRNLTCETFEIDHTVIQLVKFLHGNNLTSWQLTAQLYKHSHFLQHQYNTCESNASVASTMLSCTIFPSYSSIVVKFPLNTSDGLSFFFFFLRWANIPSMANCRITMPKTGPMIKTTTPLLCFLLDVMRQSFKAVLLPHKSLLFSSMSVDALLKAGLLGRGP